MQASSIGLSVWAAIVFVLYVFAVRGLFRWGAERKARRESRRGRLRDLGVPDDAASLRLARAVARSKRAGTPDRTPARAAGARTVGGARDD